MGKKAEENEEDESYTSKAFHFALDYVFSMIIPVAILVYAAPNKSVDFIVDSVKEKADLILDVNFSDIQEAFYSIFEEMLPMLQAELDAFKAVASQPWATYFSAAYSWVEVLPWQAVAVVSVVLLLAVLFFPWRILATWTANTIWRTAFLFIGMMPVDDGVSLLSDKEAGNYRVFVVVAAALLTLIANYVSWVLFWVVLRFFFRGLFRLVRGSPKKKAEAPKKGKKVVAEKGSRKSHEPAEPSKIQSVEISEEDEETKKDI